MKPLSLKNKIDLAFAAVAIVFCILVYSTYNRAASVTQNRAALVRTYNSNTVLEKILSSMTDVETGGRGYTITGKENFLSIYESGKKDVDHWIDSLEDMQGSHKEDVDRIAELKSLIEHKKEFTILTIATRREKGMDAAVDLISSEKGKEIMDSIR
ncbi:CHASE3 domain-containing protein [Flavobacterium sp.]|uniref:CHASE3 domain-containing protein n=1 Tax=Flavobacterium sp. TaxID=239 RepID=UPI0012156D09|nr:CHASE3 domain-containing protein [Flavobacterium sp.]RZJ70899.1 MAG: hypothetical protein EOO49_12235 [Flavobacterium sp.]